MAFLKSKKAKKVMRKRAPRRRVPRSITSGVRTFTELMQASPITVNAGGVFTCKFQDLPQAPQYSDMYKQFCIKKLQVILLPNYTQTDPNTAIGLTLFNFTQPRLAYSVDDTPNLNLPTTEIDVLASNGARVVDAGKKVVITCRPKPNLAPLVAGGIYVGTRQKGSVWLNTDSGDVNYSGTTLPHGGIRFWLSGNPAVAPYVQYNVYYRITFSMRDPA